MKGNTMETLDTIMAAWREGCMADAETLAKLLLSGASDRETLHAVSEIAGEMLAREIRS